VAGANDPTKPFPVPSRLFTISELGGWDAVNAKFFDEGGLVPEIQKATGRSQ
jgi:ABC-type sulfate transport system substrate-binding protein